MIDIHTHIMPGVDDGAKDIHMAIQMIRNAVAGGTTDIILTPHCATAYGFYNYDGEELEEHFQYLCREVAWLQIPVRLHPGMEVLYEGQAHFLYHEKDFYPLCGSRYLLVEHYFDISREGFLEGAETVHSCGYIPIVAHPERYACVQEDCLSGQRSLLLEAKEKGALFQVNKGSLAGKHGEKSLQTGEWMLEQDLVDFIASDAHHPRFRNAGLRNVEKYIRKEFGSDRAKRLFEDHPRCIIEDNPIIGEHIGGQ